MDGRKLVIRGSLLCWGACFILHLLQLHGFRSLFRVVYLGFVQLFVPGAIILVSRAITDCSRYLTDEEVAEIRRWLMKMAHDSCIGTPVRALILLVLVPPFFLQGWLMTGHDEDYMGMCIQGHALIMGIKCFPSLSLVGVLALHLVSAGVYMGGWNVLTCLLSVLTLALAGVYVFLSSSRRPVHWTLNLNI